MLGKPRDGWSAFRIKDKGIYEVSYLTDIACDWLEQAIHGMQTLTPFAVHGFCEPGRMVCLVSYYACYIVFESDEKANKYNGYEDLYDVDFSMLDFCKALYNDINDNLEEWVFWDLDDPDDEDCEDVEAARKAAAERREKLTEQLNQLKALIEDKEECWDSRHCFF